ncbi:hypothetical protein IW262DRAFT_1402347 [Armillaria fumosa]|nr:hypothetical protein IW262DRAFT_1402347 [Armillaria fumosa]
MSSVPIAQLTGPLVIGHFFNWGLFGALTLQAYIYYIAFPTDRFFPTKALALTIYLFEVAQTCIATSDAFRNFGTGWGDLIQLDALGTYWINGPLMTSLVSATGQFFYAWRIWILTKEFWVPSVIVLLSLTQAVAGIYAGVWADEIGHFSEIQTKTYVVTSMWLAGTALCDVIISVTMTWSLLRARSGIRSTDILVIKIVRLTVETGSTCAAFAIIDLVFYRVYQHNNYHLVPSIALSKLYSNSLFAVLNSRVRIVGGRTGDSTAPDPTLTNNGAVPRQALSVRHRQRSKVNFAMMEEDVRPSRDTSEEVLNTDVRSHHEAHEMDQVKVSPYTAV